MRMLSPFKTLVQRLFYPNILNTIDTINKVGEIGLSPLNEEEQEELIKLPRIIVIGDESAGKSSTLERIAMADVLPRNTGICTRQPVVLKLRKDEKYKHDKPFLKLTIPNSNKNEEGITCQRVCELITEHMEDIAERESGVIIANEITVEVRSNGVPTIDLVDLPGLVAVKANQNLELPKLTEKCTEDYLNKESTGGVVCVIDAGMDNLRSSNAIKLLQRAPEKIRNHAIGVFAKADKCEDRDWEDFEDDDGNSKPGPFWKLEERILGEAEDYVGAEEPFLGVKRGFIAVVNRNSKSKAKKSQSLADHNKFEIEWRENKFVHTEDCYPVHPKVLACVGLDALVAKMDSVICQYLGQDWVPRKLEELETKRREVHQERDSLGVPPSDLSVKQLQEAAEAKILNIFPHKAEEICKSAVEDHLPYPVESDASAYDNAVKTYDFRKKVEKMIMKGSIFDHITNEMQDVVNQCFSNDIDGQIQLHRFVSMRESFHKAMTCYMDDHRESFNTAASELVKHFFAMSSQKIGMYLERDNLKFSLINCALELLVFPCINLQEEVMPFVRRGMENLKEVPEETFAQKRSRCNEILNRLDEIETHYRSIMHVGEKNE